VLCQELCQTKTDVKCCQFFLLLAGFRNGSPVIPAMASVYGDCADVPSVICRCQQRYDMIPVVRFIDKNFTMLHNCRKSKKYFSFVKNKRPAVGLECERHLVVTECEWREWPQSVPMCKFIERDHRCHTIAGKQNYQKQKPAKDDMQSYFSHRNLF
jgi:hypothetical protein